MSAGVDGDECSSLALEGALDLAAAGPLAQSLLAHCHDDLNIDASGAPRLGAPCAQVLLSARATWRSQGHSLRILKPSDEFKESACLLGLEAHLLGDQ